MIFNNRNAAKFRESIKNTTFETLSLITSILCYNDEYKKTIAFDVFNGFNSPIRSVH
jgi:hypothetical protein